MDNILKHNIMLIYPPSDCMYQRGEDRCQSNIDKSTATSLRACNDLGYAASALIDCGYEVMIKDYQGEKLSLVDLIYDIDNFKPQVIFLSTTNATIFDDIKVVKEIKKKNKNTVIILKGAIFYNPEDELINQLDLSDVDYLIGGESDFIIARLLNSHFNNLSDIDSVEGILYKKEGKFIKTKFDIWNDNLDLLKFPYRELMNNKLYVRPDTKELQATISTSRGCPSSCIFCLTPKISGKKLRLRSPENILKELEECYDKHKIKNFFFKADTFTFDKEWTKKLCKLIINSKLKGKISWAANSRVNTIDEETLLYMKKAGCWLIAFGFESGSEKSLKLMKKGVTLEQNIKAAKMARKAGLKVYGFYLVGFPWENKEDLKATEKMIYKIDADFIELHIATPFYGTKLYEIAHENNLIDEKVLGKDYFSAPSIGTKYLSIDYIQKYRQRIILHYHTRFSYIFKKLIFAINKPVVIFNYFKYGFRLIKNTLFN